MNPKGRQVVREEEEEEKCGGEWTAGRFLKHPDHGMNNKERNE